MQGIRIVVKSESGRCEGNALNERKCLCTRFPKCNATQYMYVFEMVCIIHTYA